MPRLLIAVTILLIAYVLPARAEGIALPAGVQIQQSIAGPVLADSNGSTLYTFNLDRKPGKMGCTHSTGAGLLTYDCLVAFRPLVPVGDAELVEGWTLITRDDDGTKQWAYLGKPVYVYALDTRPGSVNAAVAARYASEWQALRVPEPMAPGITVHPSAFGEVLADAKGMTLYTSGRDTTGGAPSCVGSCLTNWHPALAGAIASPIRNFTIVVRNDGMKQWAYGGKPLYTYAGDRVPKDLSGEGVDEIWHAAVVHPKEPAPIGVTVEKTVMGDVYADARGYTLYGYFGALPAKDLSALKAQCGDKCDRVWRVATVPEGARLSGSWSALPLSDGTKQVAYKGIPLYTYNADTQKGDIQGNRYGAYPSEWFSPVQADPSASPVR